MEERYEILGARFVLHRRSTERAFDPEPRRLEGVRE